MESNEPEARVDRTNVTLTTMNGQPALDVPGGTLMLRTTVDGETPDSVDTDHFGEGSYFLLGLEDGRRAEITPEYHAETNDTADSE